MTDRPIGWGDTLDDLIRAKFSYNDANTALKKKFGDKDGTLGGPEYRERKTVLLGGDKVDEKLDELGGKKNVEKPKPKRAPWTKQKQTAADGSKIAQIANMGIYHALLSVCKNKEAFTEQIVQEINPGGAIIATVSYYFPESKLDHPVILLAIRGVILYIKFKAVCSRVQEIKHNLFTVGSKDDEKGGLKPGLRTEMRK